MSDNSNIIGNNSIIINNSKGFNATFEMISLHNLNTLDVNDCIDINVGDSQIPVFFGLEEVIDTNYFVSPVQKMLFQRLCGMALRRGLKFTEEGNLIPMDFEIQEIYEEVVKYNVTDSYVAFEKEIISTFNSMSKIKVCVDVEREHINDDGELIEEKNMTFQPLLNTEIKVKSQKHKYTHKTVKKTYVSLKSLPLIWAVTTKSNSEMLYLKKDLFNFKGFEIKTDDIKKIPSRESIEYQALKECIAHEILSRKNWLKVNHLIKDGKKGSYKLAYPKNTTKEKWEKFRKISFETILKDMYILDENSNLTEKYKIIDETDENGKPIIFTADEIEKKLFKREDNIKTSYKNQVISILAAFKEKGFIDDYYEYKTNSKFAGWIVDPSVKYDRLVIE